MEESKKEPSTLDDKKFKGKISKIKPKFESFKKKILKPKPNFKKFFSNISNLKSNTLRILKQVKKEFRLLWTDKFNLLLAIVIPPLIIVLLGFTMTDVPQETQSIPCMLISYDSNTFINQNDFTESKLDNYTLPYVEAVNKSSMLELVRFYNATEEIYAMEEARNALISKEISIILSLPVDFTEFLEWGLPGLIDCIPDASNIQYIQQSLNAVYDSIKIFINDNNLTPQFQIQGFEEFTIPEGYSHNFNSSIIMALSFMVFGIAFVLSILVIVQEKPIARLLLTPVKRSEILLSKYITYTLVLIFQVTLLIISSLLMGLYIAGTLLDLFLALFMIGFSGLTMGVFISSQSKTKTQANQLFLAVFLVAVLLSGIFIPIEGMPIYLQVIAYILPLSHGDPLIRGIIQKGQSIAGLHFIWLLVISLILVIISFIIFKRRKYEV
ncbi:MAG: ABC transporter permease [Promethearchaeota archaeon]